MDAHTYKIAVDWVRDRIGTLSSETMETTIAISAPPEFKGKAGKWSPEHLFVAAIGSCFMTTFLAVAEKARLEFSKFSCSAVGFLEIEDNKWRVSKVALHPTLCVSSSKMMPVATNILRITEHSCIISRSVTAQILMLPKIEVAS